MPPGFGPYLPLPRGAGLAAEKGYLVRGWAQGRDGPESPSPGAPQARLIELPFVVGVFWAGRLGPLLECGDLPADEETAKVCKGPHETHLWKDRIFGPPKHSRRLISAVLL